LYGHYKLNSNIRTINKPSNFNANVIILNTIKMNQTLSAIIWDWNGTLLDDVLVNLYILNHALEARGYNKISLTKYRENFTFPVKDFYQSLGFDFDKEDFNRLSNEFINDYFENMKKTRLFDGVIEILTFFKQSRIPQYVLSAMEQKRLEQSLSGFNILHFFDKVKGLNISWQTEKLKRGKNLLQKPG